MTCSSIEGCQEHRIASLQIRLLRDCKLDRPLLHGIVNQRCRGIKCPNNVLLLNVASIGNQSSEDHIDNPTSSGELNDRLSASLEKGHVLLVGGSFVHLDDLPRVDTVLGSCRKCIESFRQRIHFRLMVDVDPVGAVGGIVGSYSSIYIVVRVLLSTNLTKKDMEVVKNEPEESYSLD